MDGHNPGHDDTLERLRAALNGRYTVERLLGEGGMGRVYLGLDEALQRQVAIKIIRGDHLSSGAARERFLREARVVAALRHPAIVTVFAAGDHDGFLWFAMEYVEGESLRDLLTRDGRQPADRVHAMVAELAQALDAAHRGGVVHRDVKPENILVERDTGRVRLADFGVARAFEASSEAGAHHTGTGFILGSPRYMSPEQVSGDASIDGRSDLYALALVGYELLTGKPVIQAAHPAAMLVEQLTTSAPPVRSVAPTASPALAEAIDGALAKKADARWPDAQAMLQVLGVDTGNSSTGGFTGSMRIRTLRRKRVVRVAAAVGVLAVALIGGFFAWRARNAGSARGLVVLPFDVPSGQPDQAWLREGSVNMLTLDLAQWRDVDVVDYERTLDLLRDAGAHDGRVSLSQASTVARKAGAASFIMGQITPGGDSLLVVARRYDRDGALKRTVQVAMARTADPRAAFDQLAVRLLDVPASTSLIALTAATTTSLAAYREYLDGLRALNSWQLDRADSLFSVAIARDSTFALAWYKRGLTRGWNGLGDTTPSSAEIALRHAGRLPERERHLVAGHRWLWPALSDQVADSAARLGYYATAIREYRAGLARDVSSAEAWYGLSDALWHLAQFRQDSSAYGPLMIEARDGFEHALALDPDMHLAYSHLVDLYRQLGSVATRWVMIRGAIVTDSSVPDTAVRRAARQASDRQMLAMAERWAAADPSASRSWQVVAEALGRTGRPDSAAALMRALDAKLAAELPAFAVRASYFDFLSGTPRAAANLRTALGDGSLPWWRAQRGTSHAFIALAVTTASGAGDGALMDDWFSAWERADARDARDERAMQVGAMYAFPFSTRHELRALFMPWWRMVFHATLGAPVTPTLREQLRRGTRDGVARFQKDPYDRSWFTSVAYAAFMLTDDSTHAHAVRLVDKAGSYPELEASVRLLRGDTAGARTIRQTFANIERVRSSNLGLSGLRTQQRVRVLLALGDSAEALGHLEALEPLRFNLNFLEPGFAWYVRSLALRATLAERLGHRDRAIAAWKELLQRWSVDDPDTAALRAEARAALARLTPGAAR